jgi:hypothetical protein
MYVTETFSVASVCFTALRSLRLKSAASWIAFAQASSRIVLLVEDGITSAPTSFRFARELSEPVGAMYVFVPPGEVSILLPTGRPPPIPCPPPFFGVDGAAAPFVISFFLFFLVVFLVATARGDDLIFA